MNKSPATERRAREVTPLRGAGGSCGAAHQVGSDLRQSADAMKKALDRALDNLEMIDAESAFTALVGRISTRFQDVHRDISCLASELRSPASAGKDEGRPLDQTSRA